MVEEIFAERIKNVYPYRNTRTENIQVIEPIDELVRDIKRAVRKYKSLENKDIKVSLCEKNHNIAILS